MRVYRERVLLVVAVVLSFARICWSDNYYGRHGHNYIYLENVGEDEYDTREYMPVVWDVRNAFFQLRDYYCSYGWDDDSQRDYENTYEALDSLLQEGESYGISFANCRSELRIMSDTELESGPEEGQYFVEVAKLAREASLHLIAGGFETDLSSATHNDLVVDYLSEYADYGSWFPGEGDFLGVFGFDEPDARYEGPSWENCEYNYEWYKLVDVYADDSRQCISEDILPFGTFLVRWKTKDEDSLYYRETIPLFCEELEAPILVKYPRRFRRIDDYRDFPDQIQFEEIIGFTDLLPSGSVDYGAYASHDELFAVDDEGTLRIYSFVNAKSQTDTMEVVRVDSLELPPALGTNPVWAASDFRAIDIGDRSSAANLLNGAVALFNPADPSVNLVAFHDGSEIAYRTIEGLASNAIATDVCCVGECNYPIHHDSPQDRRGGLIGHGELRILVCLELFEGTPPHKVHRAIVFEWNGSSFANVTGSQKGIELDVEPDGAAWGIFWPNHNYWSISDGVEQSGFLVYNTGTGAYQAVYETEDDPELWTASDTRQDDIFEAGEELFVARRSNRFPCFTAGMDYVCRLIPGQSVGGYDAVLDFRTGFGRDQDEALRAFQSAPFDLPGQYTFSNVNDACCYRPLRYGRDDHLLVSIDNGVASYIYRSDDPIDFRAAEVGGELEIELLTSDKLEVEATDAPLLATGRVYGVRRPVRSLLADNSDTGHPDRVSLLRADIDVQGTGDLFQDYDDALDTMFVYGIDGTDRSNCLLPNVRCAGRAQDGQLSYYASQDTLLYLMACPVVHGARGLHLRALDFALMCGNGGPPYPANLYRCPPLLLNWGPGVDKDNVDMLSRAYGVLRMLTGEGTSNPDFLSALIDENWEILDWDHAQNATWESGFQPDPDNDWLNFVALEHSVSEEVLVIIVNDGPAKVEDAYIVFPGKWAESYDKHHIGGFEENMLRDKPTLCLFYDFVPAYSASLYWLERK
ncbi:hypothetical protein GF402_03935 [Candidatus Fermentibacteria bacterium]|nr:hypothetical protein [Candidatus Fermentibacteria bacterium]